MELMNKVLVIIRWKVNINHKFFNALLNQNISRWLSSSMRYLIKNFEIYNDV